MVQEQQLRGPYAPPATVLAVIRRMHERGLPEHIDDSTLAVAGVPDSLFQRVIAALRFLGLVDESNRRTDLFTRLGRATTEEYPELLSEVVRAAYAPIFEFGIDPAQDNEQRIVDAFRRYEPSGQRVSMARLFRGLCQEAGLAPQEAAAPRQPRNTPPRQRAPRQDRAPVRQQDTPSPAPDRADLRPIHQMVDSLPYEGWWTQDRRERWLRGLEALIDWAIEVKDAPPQPAANDEEDTED
ncbi:MAG TPA: DUF5343 domain-containing protein [Dehalococcoidia bacterium]|nr:DUF5343 domain-containing protein [Dehalococcoidia bacterium]